MTHYFIDSRTRKYVKRYGHFSFARNLSNKYGQQLLNVGLDVLKTSSKKVAHKADEATDEFIGNKIAKKIVKPDGKYKKYRRNNYSTSKERKNIE